MTAPPRDQLTLGAVLGADGLAALTERIRRVVEDDVKPAARIQSVAMLQRAVAGKLAEEAHIDILGLLADGWNKAAELDDCRKRSAQSPQATMIVTLGAHTISRDLKPEIVVSYGAVQRFPVDVSLTVAGTFEGVELALKAGRIISVGSGQCDVSVRFSVAGKAVGKPWVLKRWRLPGERRFDPPLAWARPLSLDHDAI